MLDPVQKFDLIYNAEDLAAHLRERYDNIEEAIESVDEYADVSDVDKATFDRYATIQRAVGFNYLIEIVIF